MRISVTTANTPFTCKEHTSIIETMAVSTWSICKMASDLFGWELIYSLAERDITKKEDVLIALTHFCFIKFGLKCIGVGDSKTLTDSDVGKEILPDGWSGTETYTLRYVHNNSLYILKGVKTEADIVLNLLRVSDLSVSIIHFRVEDVVQNLKGDIAALVPNYRNVIRTIQKELLEPVVTGTNKEATTQTTQPARPTDSDVRDPLRIGQPRRGIGAGFDHNWDPNRDPLAIGRSDLDPFYRGGGMLFSPFGRRGRTQDLGGGIPGGIPR